MHICVDTCVYTYVWIQVYTDMHAYMCVQICIDTCVDRYALICVYTDTCGYMCIHVHVEARSPLQVFLVSNPSCLLTEPLTGLDLTDHVSLASSETQDYKTMTPLSSLLYELQA